MKVFSISEEVFVQSENSFGIIRGINDDNTLSISFGERVLDIHFNDVLKKYSKIGFSKHSKWASDELSFISYGVDEIRKGRSIYSVVKEIKRRFLPKRSFHAIRVKLYKKRNSLL